VVVTQSVKDSCALTWPIKVVVIVTSTKTPGVTDDEVAKTVVIGVGGVSVSSVMVTVVKGFL
jgi:hypothetical protein